MEEIRPPSLHYFDAMKNALLLFKTSFRSSFTYAFLISLINQLLSIGFINTFNYSSDRVIITSPWIFTLYVVCFFVEMLLGNAFILIRQNAVLTSQKISFSDTLQPILTRLPAILLSGLLVTTFSIIGMGLYVVPGLIFMTCFYLFLPSILFAHKKAFEAWGYSFNLVKKHFFSTLALILTSSVLLCIPPLIANLGNFPLSNSNTYFGLEITLMILLSSLILLLMNAMNIVWFYLLHKKKQ